MPRYILGIESSCDDTAAAVLCDGRVLSNVIANQEVHIAYGGVVPELASRAHQQNIIPVVQQAIAQANIDKKQLSAVSFTRGPGLLGSLLVGTSFAKSMAMGLKIPLIEVNHMQAHLLAHFIEDESQTKPQFPFLGITLSGGHTQFVLVKDYFDMHVVGQTLDDAVGEAFDKCGKMFGLPYPSGPLVDKLAAKGDPKAFNFPKPEVSGLDVSFSGLKTGVRYFLEKKLKENPNFIEENLENLCASLQYTVVSILSQKWSQAVEQLKVETIAIGGGVSANSGIRNALIEGAKQNGWKVHLPKFAYTTDNAAMIAIAGDLKFKQSLFSNLDAVASARLKF